MSRRINSVSLINVLLMMNPSPQKRVWVSIRSILLLSLLSWSLTRGLAQTESAADSFWPQWRGPLATGAAPHADPPVTWSETNNVKWKTPIPGEGDSTPIVWDNRVFLLSAIATGKKPTLPVAADAPNQIYQ